MPSNQCLWLLTQLTLFAWLYSLAHKKRTLHVQENVEKKLMFVTDSYYFDGSKTFRLAFVDNVAHVRRLYHCQNPSDDDIRGQGSQD